MYICPRCKGTLNTVSEDGIDIEQCPGCNGMWLDADELGILIQGVQEDTVKKSSDKQTNPPHEQGNPLDMVCPKCDGQKLIAFIYDGDTGIELDSCPRCHGLWLDDKELKQIEFFVNMNKETKLGELKGQAMESKRIRTEEERLTSAVEFIKRSGNKWNRPLFRW